MRFTSLIGVGVLVLAAGLSSCNKDSLCAQSTCTQQSSPCQLACTNYAQKCGGSGSSSFSSSSSGTMQDCVQMCDRGLGSRSGSSSVAYKDLLACVGNATSCLEIERVCSP
jgi:hypothetical protein